MSDADAGLVTLGRITGLYGVRGWVKVFSHTEPRDNILRYNPWQVRLKGQWRALRLAEGRAHNQGIVARLEGYADRDAAAVLLGADIAVQREQFQPLANGEYYWADLIGLKVVTTDGVGLGVVDGLMETGANDVLVVRGERERLIPYLPGQVVVAVDREAGELRVDWDPEF